MTYDHYYKFLSDNIILRADSIPSIEDLNGYGCKTHVSEHTSTTSSHFYYHHEITLLKNNSPLILNFKLFDISNQFTINRSGHYYHTPLPHLEIKGIFNQVEPFTLSLNIEFENEEIQLLHILILFKYCKTIDQIRTIWETFVLQKYHNKDINVLIPTYLSFREIYLDIIKSHPYCRFYWFEKIKGVKTYIVNSISNLLNDNF